MTENEIAQVEAQTDTSPVEENLTAEEQVAALQPKPETSEKPEEISKESKDPQNPSDSEQPEEKVEGTQDTKPSRVDRRIHQLLEENRQLKERMSVLPTPTPIQPPAFTPQDYEEGIDPNAFLEQVRAETTNQVRQELAIKAAQDSYTSGINEHIKDAESIGEIDSDLEKEALAEYDMVNNVIDPRTGEKQFVPAVKLSEIVHKLEARATRLASKIAEGNTLYAKKVSQSSSVPTSSVPSSKSVNLDNFEDVEKAYGHLV